MFGMKFLWKYICKDNNWHKRNIQKFIVLYTCLCIVVPLLLGGIIGLFTGFSFKYVENMMVFIGYIGVMLGFFGSMIYAYRQ